MGEADSVVPGTARGSARPRAPDAAPRTPAPPAARVAAATRRGAGAPAPGPRCLLCAVQASDPVFLVCCASFWKLKLKTAVFPHVLVSLEIALRKTDFLRRFTPGRRRIWQSFLTFQNIQGFS